MGYGISSGDSYGQTGYTTLLSGKRKINKATKGNKRAGMSYTTVRRANGTIGHKYGSQPIVWLKPKKPLRVTGGAAGPPRCDEPREAQAACEG
jgi:hypothetical protein